MYGEFLSSSSTRVTLGADWQIDIDVWTTPARTGDVILLCTDGLSGFVDDAAVARTLEEHESLDAAVRALIDAANAAGGEDNITAVALRLEEEEGEPEAGEETGEVADDRPTGTLEAVIPEPIATETPAEPPPGGDPGCGRRTDGRHGRGARGAAGRGCRRARRGAVERRPTARYRPSAGHGETLITVRLRLGLRQRLAGPPPRPRAPPGVFAAVVALMLCVLWAALIGLRWSHFVGVDPATGKVAIYQGLPYDLGGGVKLFSLVHLSRIPAATLPARAAGTSSTTPCAPVSLRARSSRSSSRPSRERRRPALEPQSRARLAAARGLRGRGRLHVRAGRALGRRLDALADLRGRLPRAARHRARRPAHRAARRRSGAPARRRPARRVGIVEIYRLDPTRARDQAIWLAIGVGCFVALLTVLSDYRSLERYRYLIGVASLATLALTIASSYATGTVVNGARVWIRVGGLSFQPGEFAKLGLVLFMAAFLREKRELLASRERRVLGIGLPQFKHLSPLALMGGGALALLVLMNDFGTSLLFFGVFLAMLYLATEPPDLRRRRPRPVRARRLRLVPLRAARDRPRRHLAAPLARRLRHAATRACRRSTRSPTAARSAPASAAATCSRTAGSPSCRRSRPTSSTPRSPTRPGSPASRRCCSSTCWSSSAASRPPAWRVTGSRSCSPPGSRSRSACRPS